ncbi:MAG TPA: hypothetical protein VIH49_07570, partial [Solirubrobacteraceae bacterium]
MTGYAAINTELVVSAAAAAIGEPPTAPAGPRSPPSRVTRGRAPPFRRPPSAQRGGRGPATLDFLGFTFYWVRSKKGRWWMTCKTRRGRLRRFS